jgi:hypothetical protein
MINQHAQLITRTCPFQLLLPSSSTQNFKFWHGLAFEFLHFQTQVFGAKWV